MGTVLNGESPSREHVLREPQANPRKVWPRAFRADHVRKGASPPKKGKLLAFNASLAALHPKRACLSAQSAPRELRSLSVEACLVSTVHQGLILQIRGASIAMLVTQILSQTTQEQSIAALAR